MKAVANAGNHPECMAEIPTISSEMIAERAAKIIHHTNIPALISAENPHIIAITMDTRIYAPKPSARENFMLFKLLVNSFFSTFPVAASAAAASFSFLLFF